MSHSSTNIDDQLYPACPRHRWGAPAARSRVGPSQTLPARVHGQPPAAQREAEPALLHGKKGLRLSLAEETVRRLERMSPEERMQFEPDQLAWIEGLDFSSGLIEAEVAGAPAPGAG